MSFHLLLSVLLLIQDSRAPAYSAIQEPIIQITPLFKQFPYWPFIREILILSPRAL